MRGGSARYAGVCVVSVRYGGVRGVCVSCVRVCGGFLGDVGVRERVSCG